MCGVREDKSGACLRRWMGSCLSREAPGLSKVPGLGGQSVCDQASHSKEASVKTKGIRASLVLSSIESTCHGRRHR